MKIKYTSIKYELTDLQKNWLDTLRKLLDPISHRRTGRSFVMAIVFIELALENAGGWVTVFDHYNDYIKAKEHLINTIRHILRQDKKIKAEYRRDAFRIVRKRRFTE